MASDDPKETPAKKGDEPDDGGKFNQPPDTIRVVKEVTKEESEEWAAYFAALDEAGEEDGTDE